MNYSNPLDAVPGVSLETRLIITENQCVERFKTKPSLNISVEEYMYLRYCNTNMSVYVKVE